MFLAANQTATSSPSLDNSSQHTVKWKSGTSPQNTEKRFRFRNSKFNLKIWLMRYFWSSSTVEEPRAILHTVIGGMVFHFTVHCTYNLLWCTVVHCCIVHCVVAIHRLGWSGDIWLHQRAAVDQYFASAWKQKSKHVAKKQWRSCWRSCVHIPLDHRTIRITQIQKRHVTRGPPPIQNALWNPPWVSRFHKIEALFTKSSSTPLKAKFHWRWSTEDMFFVLGDQGILLIIPGGCTIQLCIQYMYYTRLITSHEIKITNPYGPISLYNLKCQLICWTMFKSARSSRSVVGKWVAPSPDTQCMV